MRSLLAGCQVKREAIKPKNQLVFLAAKCPICVYSPKIMTTEPYTIFGRPVGAE